MRVIYKQRSSQNTYNYFLLRLKISFVEQILLSIEHGPELDGDWNYNGL